MVEPPTTCAECGEPGTPIVYGLPGPDMMEAANEGRIVLGGCVVFDDAPRWRCSNGHAWTGALPSSTAPADS